MAAPYGRAIMSGSSDLIALAERVLKTARRKGFTLVTAESCTAGQLAKILSEAPGAAEHLHGGFVTYTKDQKTKALGVSAGLLRAKGAVCRDVAIAMAQGALVRSPAQYAVAITGVAGPDPDEDNNPVGLVCAAVASETGETLHFERRYGNIGREAVCAHAMRDALAELIDAMERVKPRVSA